MVYVQFNCDSETGSQKLWRHYALLGYVKRVCLDWSSILLSCLIHSNTFQQVPLHQGISYTVYGEARRSILNILYCSFSASEKAIQKRKKIYLYLDFFQYGAISYSFIFENHFCTLAVLTLCLSMFRLVCIENMVKTILFHLTINGCTSFYLCKVRLESI